MKKSRILVLALAVAAAGGAFMLANSPKPAPVQTAAPAPVPTPTDQVLVASREVPIGTVVGDADMSWQAWPKANVAAGMIARSAEPGALDELRGSIARAAFYQGEPVHREKLIKGTGSGFMSAILPSGMRAVAINIDSQGSTSAGGFILPNDRVDVVRTFQEGAPGGAAQGSPTYVSETILRNVRVLAIGQNVQEKNGQPVVVGSNATLELDPVQAETIILAQRTGQLSLTLRSLQDVNKEQDAVQKSGDGPLTIVRFGLASEGVTR
jgi:pilus assembly protein CpaB